VADRQAFVALECAAEGCVEVAVDNTGAAHSRDCAAVHGGCIPVAGEDAHNLAAHRPGVGDNTIVPLWQSANSTSGRLVATLMEGAGYCCYYCCWGYSGCREGDWGWSCWGLTS
jgi:hypothetical protein